MSIRRVATGTIVVFSIAFSSGMKPNAAEPLFVLPAPTGPFAVGTTAWALSDPSRQETLGGVPGPRQVQVVAWYPASSRPTGVPAPYLRAGLAEAQAFATLMRKPATMLDGLGAVATHGGLDAPVAAGPGLLPVLLFSHGYTAVPSAYTGLLEDLASHGYVVLSVVHTYEASAAALPGGRTVTLLNDSGGLIQGVRDVSTEWASEDQAMTAVTSAVGEEAQRARLREYLSTLKHTLDALRRWTDDDRLVLDRFLQKPASGPGARLAARVNSARVGVFGHSMGGVTGAQFCLEDKRCAAVLNLDGIPQYGPMIDATLDRPLLMVYSERPGRAGASDAIYRPAAARYYRVDVAGTRHLDFSDMVFWPPLRDLGALGSIQPARALSLTRTIVREFFDEMLRGTPSPLLAGRTAEDGVRVTTPRRSAGPIGTGQATPASAAGTATVKLFFVALEDGGKSGAAIGCGDSLVAVQRVIPRTATPLAATIRDLLSIRESRWGQSGLYNALASSQLDLVKATIVDGVADIRLAGALTLGGTCDAPRVEAQLREAARQFPAIQAVNVFVNDVPLATALSARGR